MEHLSPPPTPDSTPTPPRGLPLQPVQPTYYQQQPYSHPTQRPSFITRSLRFILRRLMYFGVIIGRGLAPFKVGLSILLPLFVIAGALTTALLWDRIAGPPAPVERVDSLPPSPEVESFLEGQRTYNVEKMWNAFSQTFKSRLTIDELQADVRNQRAEGISFLSPVYVGGVPLKSGGAIYFYMVNARAPSQSSSIPLSFEFHVGSDGKIVNFKISGPSDSSSS